MRPLLAVDMWVIASCSPSSWYLSCSRPSLLSSYPRCEHQHRCPTHVPKRLLCNRATYDPKVGVKVTNRPAIANAPQPFESSGSFSNYHLAALVLGVPFVLTKFVPYFSFKTSYIFLLLLTGLPVVVAYWMIMSRIGGNVRDYGILPRKNIEEYMTITDSELKALYHGQKKMPIQVFYDSYFDNKIELKGACARGRREGGAKANTCAGDMLELLEYRHDWASFEMTFDLMKYVFTNLIPDVVWHSPSQDEEQVRDHYDRGDDFCTLPSSSVVPEAKH
jgi:hypothetical protein